MSTCKCVAPDCVHAEVVRRLSTPEARAALEEAARLSRERARSIVRDSVMTDELLRKRVTV